MSIYVVKAGDNVDLIAARYHISVDTLIYDNQIVYPYRLAVGQALFVADGVGDADKPPLIVGGYAYPYIDSQILTDTVTSLSELYIFSYGFTAEGKLVPPHTDELWMIPIIWRGGAQPVLTLTPLGADGFFNNNLASALFSNPAAQQNLVNELKNVMHDKGYAGLDIDFEYILPEDRIPFAQFVFFVTQRMNAAGYQVTVALAPKTSGEQRGLLYEGMDYQLLGAAANRVLLMTYEWGYTYGPPMAVAPIHQVRRVVDYAVTQIPVEKISLGIPNYGYDWPLPYERGVTSAVSLGTLEAIALAIQHGAEIQFDEQAKSPYFNYWQYGVEHVVWFEDVRSLKAKFDLVKEYGLSGVGYWQLMRYYRANWLLLQTMFEVRR